MTTKEDYLKQLGIEERAYLFLEEEKEEEYCERCEGKCKVSGNGPDIDWEKNPER